MSIRHADLSAKALLQICDGPDKSTLVVSAATKLSIGFHRADLRTSLYPSANPCFFLRRIVAASQQKQA
jgi:hypothetical protein